MSPNTKVVINQTQVRTRAPEDHTTYNRVRSQVSAHWPLVGQGSRAGPRNTQSSNEGIHVESTIRTDVDNYQSATPERVTFERKPLERTILSECHFSKTSFERLTNTVNAILAIINYIDTNSSATNLSDCLAIIQRQVERKQITIMAISIKIGEIRIQCNIGRQERFLLYDSYDQREDNNDANEERIVIFATDEMLHVLWRNRHGMANGTVKGTNPALKKPSNIPEIYAKMFGRIHWSRL